VTQITLPSSPPESENGDVSPKPEKIPSGQIQPRHDRIQIYHLPAVAKGIASVQMNMAPGRRRNLLDHGESFHTRARPVLGQQSRQDGRVVVDDRVRDQSRALVADLDLDVGLAGEFLLAADLGDGSAQLVVRLKPILRALDVTLQLWIAEIPQGVDAADQFVELEDRAPRRVRLGVGAQLPDQGALGHFLEAQCRYDLIDVGVFIRDGWLVTAATFRKLLARAGDAAELGLPIRPRPNIRVTTRKVASQSEFSLFGT
jgi:hypothetical protein